MAEGSAGGDAVNGGGADEGEARDLKVPDEVVREGCRVVRRELERVVVIEME